LQAGFRPADVTYKPVLVYQARVFYWYVFTLGHIQFFSGVDASFQMKGAQDNSGM
jgi:hypothetical protein